MTDWASPAGGGNRPDDRPTEQGAPTGPPEPRPQPQYGQYAGPPEVRPQPQYGQYAGPPPPYGQTPPFGQAPPPYGYGPMAPQIFTPKPGVIPLRPLKLGDIFEGAFRTVRGNPGATVGLALAVSMLFAIPSILLTLVLGDIPFESDGTGDTSFLVASNASQVFSFVAAILLSGMLVVVVAEAVLGHRASIGEAWTRIRPRFWSLLGATLLIVLAMVLIIGVLVAMVIGVYAAAGDIAAIISGVLAVIIGLCALVWLGTKTSLATAAISLEKLGPIAGLKRSWALTNGQFWRILGITLLAQMLVGMIASLITVPAMMVGMAGVFATTDPESATMPVGFLIFVQVVTILASAITAPFTASVTGLLYIDQRIRREALDLNLMTAAGLK